MMEESAGMSTQFLGFHIDAFLMIAAGLFYILSAILIWKSYKKDKNELVGALLAFLIYQAINMFFMGLELNTMNIIYSNIAALAIFIGSAYMLKFPMSSLSKGKRRVIFFITLIVLLVLYSWFMQTEEKQMSLMHFVLWYDIVVNGIVVGGFMFLLALRTKEKKLKIKALGGGTGVVSCCVVSNVAMLSSAMLTSAFFGFLAPIFILGSLLLGKRK